MNLEIERLMRQWERIHAHTAMVMKAAPDDKLEWKPVETVMSLGELLRHLVSAEHFLVTLSLTGQGQRPVDDLKRYDVAGLVEAFDQQHQRLTTQVAALNSDQWKETIDFKGRDMSRLTLLWGLTEHEVHHRGQLFTYLRLLGIEPPTIFH
jgi:uncharacterized damage-inducible protein DinB